MTHGFSLNARFHFHFQGCPSTHAVDSLSDSQKDFFHHHILQPGLLRYLIVFTSLAFGQKCQYSPVDCLYLQPSKRDLHISSLPPLFHNT